MAHFKDCQGHDDPRPGATPTCNDASNLAHFKDCKNLTPSPSGQNEGRATRSLAHLRRKGMSLMHLWIDYTAITDLSPLQDMPLEEIRLTPKNITRGLDILRDRKSLKTIGIAAWDQDWPAAEFWEPLDEGEFKE